MKLVVDANVVISALIADSKTRELIVTLEPDLLTPEFVYDEIENYTELIVQKSGMSPSESPSLSTSCFSTSRSFPPRSSIRTSKRPKQQSVTQIPTTCYMSRAPWQRTRQSGVTTLISTNRLTSRRIRRAT